MVRLVALALGAVCVLALAAFLMVHRSDSPRLADQPKPAGFEFMRVTTDLAQSEPVACLVFSRPLDSKPETHWTDWIALSPTADAAYHVKNGELCIDGLRLAKAYDVAIAAGLPARDGSRLPEAVAAKIDFKFSGKLVRFSGPGFILPRSAAATVALDTTNVAQTAVEVLKVNERLAPALINSLRRQTPSYTYALNELVDRSARTVWSGSLETKGTQNELVHTGFPFSQLVGKNGQGVYLLVAADNGQLEASSPDRAHLWERGTSPYYFEGLATQFVVETDIALTSVTASDGLHVFARSLATASSLAGVEIELHARDSEVLGHAKTGSDGQVLFAPGLLRGTGAAGAETAVAFGDENDFAVLDITQPAFDLSDRGVAGRDTPGPLDAFVYTDRGIYRPGETIHAVALLRDRVGQAIDSASATLVLRKPNGVVFRRATLAAQPGGVFRLDVNLPDAASRGGWTVEATDDDGKIVGQASIEVQDFIPQRLKVSVSSNAKILHPGEDVEVAVNGRFLYGAPASDLAAEGHIQVAIDPKPFPQSNEGYVFGDAKAKFEQREIALTGALSDEQGLGSVGGKLDLVVPPNVALKADISAGLAEPGGRVTSDRLTLPIRSQALMVGVRPRFKGAAEEGKDAQFDIIAIDADGKEVAAPLNWTLYEEVRHYDWFRNGGRWDFHMDVTEKRVGSGDLTVSPGHSASLSQHVDWGYYRLIVTGPDDTAANYEFRSGWITSESPDIPDKVDVSVEQPRYKPGDTARVRIVPPFAGKVRLMVARDRVFDIRDVEVPKEGTTIEVKTSPDWGSGAYVLASLFRPADGGRGHLPVRAIGLVWVGVDPGARALSLKLDLPEKIVPRQTIEVPVSIVGAIPSEPVYVTVAAVDEGILQLTHFVTPDPAEFFFGQRRLAAEIRDDYGNLLDGSLPGGTVRSGGDSMGGRGLPVVPVKSVALFEGPIQLDKAGASKIRLDIPDFEGELRVMVVASSRSGVGKTEGALTVRDPVVSDVALPRFLAPGDTGTATMVIDNRDGTPGKYRVTFKVDGAAHLGDAKPLEFALASHERKIATVPIVGDVEGVATVATDLEGPNGYQIKRDWQIAVRAAQYPLTVESTALQPVATSWTLDPSLLDVFVPGSVSIAVNYSRLAGIDVAGLIQSLWLYPYGCSEQIVSTAFPLIYFDDPAYVSAAADKATIRRRVQAAIDTVIDRQEPEGTFGLWRAGDGLSSDWLNMYALDFLAHARQAGYDVPDSALELGYAHATSLAVGLSNEGGYYGSREHHPSRGARYYAAWLLAPVHRIDLGILRQSFDRLEGGQLNRSNDDEDATSGLDVAHLAGALAVLGDQSRAKRGFELATGLTTRPVEMVALWRYSYWSRLRDAAAILAIGAESDQLDYARPLIPLLGKLSRTPSALTTQEKAWLLEAAHALTAKEDVDAVKVNGQALPVSKISASLTPTVHDVTAGYSVMPTDRDLYRTVTLRGTPRTPPPAMAQGLQLEKSYFAMDGSAVDPARLQQNQRFIVVLAGGATDGSDHRAVLVDLLPVGWEIEAIIRPDQAPAFLKGLTALNMQEARDDRFVAALDIGLSWRNDTQESADNEKPKPVFRVAYVARAVTVGQFTLPPASLEDMYHPGVMARTSTGSTAVSARAP